MKITLALLLPAFASVLAAESSEAKTVLYTGDALTKICSAADYYSKGTCAGYIAGIADAMSGGQPLDGYTACFSEQVTQGQLRDIGVRWLTDHPESRDLDAEAVIARALSAEYPCPRKSSKK